MQLQSALTWWQSALRMTVGVLIGGGILGLFTALRYANRDEPYPRNRRPGPLALASALALALGVGGYVAVRGIVEPRASFVSTPLEFRSATNPSVDIVAPPGWRLAFDGQTATVKGSKDADDGTTITIDSSLLDKEVVLGRLVEATKTAVTSRGVTVDGEIFSQILDGKSAMGFTARGGERLDAVWIVRRGSHFASTIHCFSRAGTEPTQACRPVLDALKWVTPADVDANDL
jgi:hypothetical protein